jgi:hypothetical protein
MIDREAGSRVVDEWSEHDVHRRKAAQVDNTVPNVARAWNYLVGGRDNFEVDRKAARQLIAVAPVMSALGPAAREFQRRLVRFLAAEAGIRAARCLDLTEPVAVILMGVLSFIDPLDVARSVARELAAAIPPGSFIAIHHAASDMDPSVAAAARLWNSMSQVPRLVPRTRAEVASLLDGLDLVALASSPSASGGRTRPPSRARCPFTVPWPARPKRPGSARSASWRARSRRGRRSPGPPARTGPRRKERWRPGRSTRSC